MTIGKFAAAITNNASIRVTAGWLLVSSRPNTFFIFALTNWSSVDLFYQINHRSSYPIEIMKYWRRVII